MGARLTRLRIAGFKSFAEPVSLDILPGLTGIVGPNGCGKSNVVEALRWAMGETSARALRGGEMDDVIFAGTTGRASRNLAEVTITLERTAEAALPAPFEAEAELQLTRRIERGAGSGYRGNGREMRARDVQTLFADLASGARSSAMVSQGRVAGIVQARPEDRRQILEEAAGITGLHARRHEAELKLRAAEQNLSKAEDLRGQLEANREGLRKQARQAARYRNISALIRNAEAEVLATQHAAAAAACDAAQSGLTQARMAVTEAEAAAEVAELDTADAEAALPGPRAAEATARSALERARLESENLSQDAARAETALQAARLLQTELSADAADGARAEADAVAACARLAEETQAARARIDALPVEIAACREDMAAAEAALGAAERLADLAQLESAQAAAAAAQARLSLTDAAARAETTRAELAGAMRTHALAQGALVAPAARDTAAVQVLRAEEGLVQARQQEAEARQGAAEATAALAAATAALDHARTAADHAAQRSQEAAGRAERIAAAQTELHTALRAAEAAQIAPEALASCRGEALNAQAVLERCEAAVHTAETASLAATQADLRAARQAQDTAADAGRAQAARDAAAARLDRLALESQALAAELAACESALIAPAAIEAAAQRVRHAEAALAATAGALREAMADHEAAEAALAASREAASQAAAECARLMAEIGGLRAALQPHGQETDRLTDAVDVPADLEAAFTAALEDAQDFAPAPAAPRFWRTLPDLPAAAQPPGTSGLGRLIQAPPCMRRALSRIALLDADADGDELQAALTPGDTLVSRRGDVWRWDGRVSRAGAPNAAAIRLQQRRRLREAEQAAAQAGHAADVMRAADADAAGTRAACAGQVSMRRAAHDMAEAALGRDRNALATLRAAAAQAADRHAVTQPAAARAATERHEAALAAAAAETALAGLPSPAAARAVAEEATAWAKAAAAALDTARADRAAARTALAQATTARARLDAEAADSAGRVTGLQAQASRLAEEDAAAQAALADARQRAAALGAIGPLSVACSAARDKEAAAAARAACCAAAHTAAQAALDAARAALARLHTARVQAETRLAAEADSLDRARADHAAALVSQGAAETGVSGLADVAGWEAAVLRARGTAAEARSTLGTFLSRAAGLDGELDRALARAPGLAAEQRAWQDRLDQAVRRRQTSLQRLAAAEDAVARHAGTPLLLDERAARAGRTLAEAEAAHAAQATRLAAADRAVRRAGTAQREADARLAGMRQACVRLDAEEAGARSALHGVRMRAAERLGADAVLPEVADASEAAEDRARLKWERLQRERDDMGPVNLRAETELEEIDRRLAGIDADREELATAIAKLRGAIGHLNREGREKLGAVFTEVDRHFRALFTRMMGGGRAHLALTGSDDPLLAGLEIFAEPPGKKLSALSLLSGGEQALTALSLIFAVFRCTPAPVAVLDEVDAPLDDANVERFCALMEDVVRETGTRFLVVTHHQVTMSRMDRLFGVTMQERGVSRLLSVDLRHASEMVAAEMSAEMAGPQAVAA